jgi:hypothetical protein
MLFQQNNNFFDIKAYALEQRADGAIELRNADLFDQTQMWSSYSDGSKFYVNIRLKFEGENIRSVDLYADDGFFAKQYLKTENGIIIREAGVPATYIGNPDGSHTIVMYGEDFEIVGSSLTLDKSAITDDLLLFLGTDIADWRETPSQMTFRAVATFNDGKTQEEAFTIDLSSSPGTGTITLPPEELKKQQAEYAKYKEVLNSIPLDRCDIVEGTVKTLTYGDTFEYQVGDEEMSGTAYFPITQESIDSAVAQGLLDENGIFRQGSHLEYDGSDGFIGVIERNGDGTFTGMVYKVPGQLILDSMRE